MRLLIHHLNGRLGVVDRVVLSLLFDIDIMHPSIVEGCIFTHYVQVLVMLTVLLFLIG